MPELKPHPYAHQPPRRPLRMPFRKTPPPERPAPPSLRWFLWIGVALAAVIVALAVPYLVSYLLSALGR